MPCTVVKAGKSRVERQEGYSWRCDLAPNARSNTRKSMEQPKLIRRQAWQGMFVCLICALNAESKPLKESKNYVFVGENRRTDFGRCDCEQFWKMLNDLLQQAQWSSAPERGSSEAWKSTMLALTHPVSSRIIKYPVSAPCPLSISQCHWEAGAVPSIDKLDLIFLWLFAKGKFNKTS